MCGNLAMPFHTLCKEHWELRMEEQTKAKEQVSKPEPSYSTNQPK